MKRSITFLTILTVLLIGAVTAEYFYSKNLIEKADSIIETEGTNAHNELLTTMESRRALHRLFYSKSKTENIINEIKKLGVYNKGDSATDAEAQLENVRYLIFSLYRFNENAP